MKKDIFVNFPITCSILSHKNGLYNLHRRQTGLRWEDLIISARAPVAEAMELADPDVIKGRMRRLKRASDLSYKGKQLTDYTDPAKLEPFKFELWEDVQKIHARDEEYAVLDLHKK